MKPIKFKEANKCLSKPKSMSNKECGSLWVFSNGNECISKWKTPFWKRVQFLFRGYVWLSVLSGGSQPPVSVTCSKTMFNYEP